VEGAEVGFEDLSQFAGSMKMGNGTKVDLMGKDVVYSLLDGSGVITNSQNDATIIINSIEETETEFSGSVKGDVSLLKKGKGVQYLSGNNTYTGSTAVEEGLLVLRGRDVANVLPVKDAVLRLDATELSQYADGTRINEWADADGRELKFINDDIDKCPTFDSQILNGKPGLWFGDAPATKLFCDNTTFQTRTIFAVYRTSPGDHTWACAGFFGRNGADKGLRFNTITQWSSSGWDNKAIYYSINGIGGISSFEKNKTNVMMAEYDSNISAPAYAVGDYWSSATYSSRFYYGWIGELIVYDRVLSDDEKLQVNDYLMKKWSVKEYAVIPSMKNALPETTALTVSGSGILDLAGGIQKVNSLSGDGVITNSASECAELIIAGAAEGSFTGRISENITLRLENGGSLDLGGSSMSVDAIEGDGRIANGTLSADEIRPGGRGVPGVLVFEVAPAAGATYVFDGFGERSDKIEIEGDFDLSTFNFRFEPSTLNGIKFEILSVGGKRTGEDFASLAGSFGAWYISHDDDNSSYIKYRGGTIILFK
jgi:autotransporter-associated beta strand protein